MDRIAALRKIERSLSALESGEEDLETCERQIRATVRTFATEFDGDLSAYRADDGTVVVAASEREARTQVRELTGADSPTLQQLD
jgi:CHASE3 domain sensor protein